MELYSNGATLVTNSLILSGILADGDVYVIANASANAAILAAADVTSNVTFFNGDDALVLKHNTTIIDSIGQVGFDPGTSWTGNGVATAEQTLRRKINICQGDADSTNAFDPSVEWDSYAQDTVDGIGAHTSNCTNAGTCGSVFISEYIEGGSFNKAIEIFNGTGTSVDLTEFTLELYSNGSATVSSTVTLTGSLDDGETYILANASAIPAILAVTDLVSSSVINFNGDDAVVLKHSGTIIDSIGQVGVDPGTAWEANGVSTLNQTLRRKIGISTGDNDPSNAFDPSVEWDNFAQDTVDGLGTHAATCGPVIVEPEPVVKINEFSASTIGTDVEFVEILGDPDTDYSAYTILEIEGDLSESPGMIKEIISIGTTDASGFWAEYLPTGSLDNNSLTLLLVRGFSGSYGNDLDTDDDGSLDLTPWAAIADSVAVDDGGSGDLFYGDPILGPNYDGVAAAAPGGASRYPDGVDTESPDDWVRNDFDLAGIPGYSGTPDFGEAYNTPGLPNQVVLEVCSDPFTTIYAIQGSGSASTLDGTEIVTEGVVVADLQSGLRGFNIQDPGGDGDPATSDGVFVYSPTPDVNVGDLVRVRGTVDEYNGLTEITSVSQLWVCNTGLTVAPTEISLPVAAVDDFEKYEGMLVTFPQDLVISEYFNFDRFGEIVLTSTRHMTPTALYEPGSPEQQQAAMDYILDRITLDDGRSVQNPDPAIHPNGAVFDMTNLFRGGDLVTNVTGVMDYSFGLYRIQPTQGADYTAVNERPVNPPMPGAVLKVASFNVLNYFTTLDGGSGTWFCGPSGDMECRGADDDEEFTRQRAKIIAAISEINADVVGLMEIENNVDDNAVIDLVAGLNDVMGVGTYDYVDTGVIGTDAIKVAMIYKPAAVTPVGDYAILDSTVDSRFLDEYNRPVLAQSFADPRSGNIFTVAVNHLKSKGSACTGDPDLNDGAGNCNLTRTAAAEALVDWLEIDPTMSESENYLIIGDLNSYDKEDPIDAILAGSDGTPGTEDDYMDMILQYQGDLAYGYVFDGQIGYLDHALANGGMQAFISGVDFWHINADEPDLIDYDTSFKLPAQDALYAPDAFRSSDHDPVIVALAFPYFYYLPIISK